MLYLDKRLPLPTISGSGFVLRPFCPLDAVSLQKHLNNKDVARDVTHIPYPYTIDHARAWVKAASRTAGKRSKRVDFVIDVDGEVAGSVAFINLDGHKAQVSMWVSPVYWRRGLATSALRHLVQFGFDALGLVRIYAYHYSENIKTRGVLEKAGFIYEGTHAKEWRKVLYGEVRLFDSSYYSIVKADMSVRSVVLSLATGADYAPIPALAVEMTRLLSNRGIAVHLENGPRSDLAISIGGDGMMMHTVTRYSEQGIPTLGINAGHLGFLTSADAGDLEMVADRIATGSFSLERRMALGYRFRGQYHGPFANEVALRHPNGIATVAVLIGDEVLFDAVPADGVLVATATGSTAYNLSAGGPILMPESTNVVFNALYPTAVNLRPVVSEALNAGGTMTFRVVDSKHGHPLTICADSFTDVEGPRIGEEVVVMRHPQPLLFATFGQGSFKRALQTKMGLHT